MAQQTELYIGLISGTSADGIDAVLVDFDHKPLKIIATHFVAYSTVVREKILALYQPGENEIQRLGELDVLLGKTFAETANALLSQQSLPSHAIRAIGSHGQTIRHHPHLPHPFTVQIGDPNIIATETGITTIADFRRKDVAYGGQGAPLVPAFHHYLFSSAQHNRVVLNIGGIANITTLSKNNSAAIIGFDTGPGNTLLDSWIHFHHAKNYDENGAWAKQGKFQPDLLEYFLSDPYFDRPFPKSTGREYFNLNWLQKILMHFQNKFSPADVQNTLAELTARSIAL